MGSLESFRTEVRDWLAESCPEDVRVGTRDRLERRRFDEWVRMLGSRGWAAPGWPTEYGGGGLDHDHQAVLADKVDELGHRDGGRPGRPGIARVVRTCQGYQFGCGTAGTGECSSGVAAGAGFLSFTAVITVRRSCRTGKAKRTRQFDVTPSRVS